MRSKRIAPSTGSCPSYDGGGFDQCCYAQAPRTESGEGKTPAIGDHQARKLLDAPEEDTIKSRRDRAILSTLLFHALRREELCKLKFKDFRHTRKGVPHLKVSGWQRGGKTRYVRCIPAVTD